MIKSNELRIGNYVLLDNNLRDESGYDHEITELRSLDCQIKLIKLDNVYGQFYKFINPIPLTEEWLIKFGFSLMTDTTPYNYRIHKNRSFCYIRYGTFGTFDNEVEKSFQGFNGLFIANKFVRVIKYVHELQNLYFALTGEELTIKENE